MSFDLDKLLSNRLLRQMIPSYIRDPLSKPPQRLHPVADLTNKIKNRQDAECMISICIEQIKFSGWNECRVAVLKSISEIKSLDVHTKAALVFLGNSFLMGKGENNASK